MSHKFRIPIIMGGQYQKYRQKISQVDKSAIKLAKAVAFKLAADRLFPGWERK